MLFRIFPVVGPWLWFAMASLVGFFILQPVGWLLVGIAAYKRAWVVSGDASIKPLPQRQQIDTWRWQWMVRVWGNPEDGVSGYDAYGPSWDGRYNPTLSRWKAFVWAGLRNWAAGYNYITWPFSTTPPVYFKNYTLFGKPRTLKIGWQQLPTSDGWDGTYKARMVFSF